MIAAVKKWVCNWSYSSAKNTPQMCFLSKEGFKNKSIWHVADQKPIFNTTKLEWCCTKVEVYPGKFLRCAPIWPQKSFSISLERHLVPFFVQLQEDSSSMVFDLQPHTFRIYCQAYRSRNDLGLNIAQIPISTVYDVRQDLFFFLKAK